MALIKCIECGNDISEHTNKCPGCGYSLIEAKKKSDTKKGAVIFSIIVIAIFLYNFKSEPKETKETPIQDVAVVRDGKSFDDPVEIEKVMKSFKTFNNKGLINTFAQYGLKIDYVFMTPIETLNVATRKPRDKDGDMVTTVEITGKFKPMPCGLDKWIGGFKEDAAEIIYRNGEWIADDENTDPILYWAATGKCSAAYGLPM